MHRIIQYLERRRISLVLPHIRGRLLDIGCGQNALVTSYGNGIGVDVYPWKGVGIVVEDTTSLPFEDGSYDTVSFVACLNHIPSRRDVLKEAHRCLVPGGTLIATMIGPVISFIWHKLIRPWDKDQTERGMKPGEVWGIGRRAMRKLFSDSGFELLSAVRFEFGLNTLYVCGRVPVL